MLTATTRRSIHVSGSAVSNVATAPTSEDQSILQMMKMTFCLTHADLQNGFARVVESEAAGAQTAQSS
jgi:hypothetical protein